MICTEDARTDRLGSRPLRAAAPLLLLTITALGGYLRFYQIGSKGLWLDEAFSIWMGQQPLAEMLQWLVRIDQHPPLYYMLLRAWLGLGDGTGTVRALSALCSTLTVPVIFLLGRRLSGLWAGLLAALLLAVSPFHVHFAQEARMYALLALSASLAMVALAHLLTDPQAGELGLGQQMARFWRIRQETGTWLPVRAIQTDLAWLCYILFTVSTLLTHNTAVFLPIAASIYVLGTWAVTRSSARAVSGASGTAGSTSQNGDRGVRPADPPTLCPVMAESHATCQGREGLGPGFLRNWLIAHLAVSLLWSPWLPTFVAQSAGVLREFWLPEPTWGAVVYVLRVFVSDFLSLPPVAAYAVLALYLALAALGAVYLARRRAGGRLLVILLITPIAGEWLVSLVRPIFYDRTLIWASIPLYLLLTAGIQRLRRWPLALAAILLALTVNGFSLREYYVRFEKEGWDEAAALVAERAVPDDLILFNATWVQIPFDYYFHRESHQQVAEHGVPVDLFDRQVLEPKMAESDLPRLGALVRGRDRVWLVYSHNWYTDPKGLIPAALEEEMHRRHQWSFYGVEVHLYAGYQQYRARTDYPAVR